MKRRIDFARLVKMRKQKLFGKQVCFLMEDFQDENFAKEWDALMSKILLKRYTNNKKEKPVFTIE